MIDILKHSGVYKITIGTRYYFGSTKGTLDERKDQHIYYLQRGRHSNRRMQNSYNKYKSMSFDVLIVCEPEFVRDYEQYLLDQHFGKEECLNMKECSRGGMNLERIDVDEAKRLYYEEKWSLERVGKYMGGLSFATIARRLREAGCVLRSGGEGARVDLHYSIAEDYKNGMSLRDLAAKHGVTHSIIRSRLLDMDVGLRDVGTPHEVTDEELKHMYLTEKLSSVKIGKKIGMSRSGVTKRLRAILGKDIRNQKQVSV